MRFVIALRVLRRALPIAWQQLPLVQPTRIAGCVTIAALNILWQGHGVLRATPVPLRFIAVAFYCYFVTTFAEFLYLLVTGPRFTGFESPTNGDVAGKADTAEQMVVELQTLPAAELRAEALQLADEMKRFEAGSDREFVKSLAGETLPDVSSETEHDELLDKQSTELLEHNLRTWRTYREHFYRPARAVRDELRRRLGIRNVNSEPRIPALDRAVLAGARPIAQAAEYLAGLARRLR
ncbi:MAG TPA: hypothetical protein VJ852_11415 [Gemmatimonadaceae bacterium]|nr:hypothetical protein [Gemmatimonadaceae bacterium]